MAETITLKVAAASNSAKVATSVIKNMQEGRDVETLSIGAGAMNQAIKAITIARGLGALMGWDLTIRPGFVDLLINNETKTAIRLIVLR
jgi:stage V sporulation protein S